MSSPCYGPGSIGAHHDAPGMPTVGDRFRILHARQRSMTSDLSLSAMAACIAEAACEVVAVRESALVLFEAGGEIVDAVVRHCFGTRAPDSPIEDATTWDDVVRHFAGSRMPYTCRDVQVSGGLFARLVVADPVGGAFDHDDRTMLDALCRSAGAALEHASLFQRVRSSVAWLHASGEIARAMLADADIDALTEIVARAVDAAGADRGLLISPNEDGQLIVLAAHGVPGRHLGAIVDPDSSDLTRAVVNGKSLRSAGLADPLSDLAAYPSDLFRSGPVVGGPLMLAPLLDALGTRGSVLLTRAPGSGAFTDSDLDQFANYTAQVALAMQFAEARVDTERLRRVEASASASRELSDIVMQRLFAVGIGLHSLSGRLAGSPDLAKLERHITDLDQTIDEIRTRVFVAEEKVHPDAVRFPRVLEASDPAPQGPVRPRGRRRADWHDGTGAAQDRRSRDAAPDRRDRRD